MRARLMSKTVLASGLGVARSTLYWISRMERKDWALNARIESVLQEHPACGSRSAARELGMSR